MICKNCGEKLKDDAKYCSKCGRNVETSKIHKNKILIKYYLIGLGVGLILIGVLAIFVGYFDNNYVYNVITSETTENMTEIETEAITENVTEKEIIIKDVSKVETTTEYTSTQTNFGKEKFNKLYMKNFSEICDFY